MTKTNISLVFAIVLLCLTERVMSDDDDDDDDDEGDEHEEDKEDEEEEETESDVEQITTEVGNETETATVVPDDEWLNMAVRDIAYYLRAHKFNDFDRRYHANEDTAPRNLFKEFPDPPLRSLHWEVRKYCESGFVDCVQYLYEKAQGAELRRSVDTVIMMRESGWSLPNNSQQMEQADRECQRMRRLDWVGAQPFLGPLERFQWRTSASYYMCWYTMREEAALSMLGEPCDNFANCLDTEFQYSNMDPRADDRQPFQCATYSFCPDPCCPRKHYHDLQECWDAGSNPCHVEAPKLHRECGFSREKNRDFVPLVLNRWNVSCKCEKKGFEWDSRFGICIDVDECVRGLHSCRPGSEACFNVAGSYACGCQWGFLFDPEEGGCVLNTVLSVIETKVGEQEADFGTGKPVSIVKLILKRLFPKSSSKTGFALCSVFSILSIIFPVYISFSFIYDDMQ